MKRFYRKIVNFLLGIVVTTEKAKTKLFEKIAIKKKKKIYKTVKWSKEQQKQFDIFWKTNYGKKIPNKWHKLYQKSNGVFNVEYIPEILFSTQIEPTLNDYYQTKVFADKNLNDLLFNNRIEGVRTPRTYLLNSFGRFYDGNRNLISKKEAINILSSLSFAVIKPTVNTSSGNDVKILSMINGVNQKTGETAEQLIEKYRQDFIVQEKIVPNEQLKALYPHSINTIRVITYILDDKINVCPISLRIGGNGSEIDNIHAGGMSIAVSNQGELSKFAYRLGYGDKEDKFDSHPDTGVEFDGYKLDFIENVVKVAKKLHTFTLGVGIISWDFTVNDKNEIIVIEANYRGQSAWFPQMLSGRALFGENTSSVLKNLNK